MKKFTLIAGIAAALIVTASATTVQFTAATSATQRRVLLADGVTQVTTSTYGNGTGQAPTAGGSLIVGTFANAGNFTFNPSISMQSNYNNMLLTGAGNPGFSQFGLAQPGNGANEVTSSASFGINVGFSVDQASGSIVDNSAVAAGQNASFFDGLEVYLVIFNGPTIGSSTQMGVFTAASWLFKTNAAGLGGSNEVGQYGTNTTNTVSAVGGAGAVITSPNNALELSAPEPSALTSLIGAGGLVAMLRRRRASK